MIKVYYKCQCVQLRSEKFSINCSELKSSAVISLHLLLNRFYTFTSANVCSLPFKSHLYTTKKNVKHSTAQHSLMYNWNKLFSCCSMFALNKKKMAFHPSSKQKINFVHTALVCIETKPICCAWQLQNREITENLILFAIWPVQHYCPARHCRLAIIMVLEVMFASERSVGVALER